MLPTLGARGSARLPHHPERVNFKVQRGPLAPVSGTGSVRAASTPAGRARATDIRVSPRLSLPCVTVRAFDGGVCGLRMEGRQDPERRKRSRAMLDAREPAALYDGGRAPLEGPWWVLSARHCAAVSSEGPPEGVSDGAQ